MQVRPLSALVLLLIPSICSASLDLGVSNSGISFGNSPVWRGLRFNLIDKHVEQIDGINVALGAWGKSNSEAHYRGLPVGLIRVKGYSIEGLAVAFDVNTVGPMRGVSVAVSTECWSFIGVSSGLGTMAEEEITGINIGAIVEWVSDPDEHGPKHVEGRIRGLTFGGVAVGSSGSIAGVSGSFGIVGANRSIKGVSLAGIAVACQYGDTGDVMGLAVGGLCVAAYGAARGACFAGAVAYANDMTGLVSASYVRAHRSNGLAIAVFNRVDELHGVEIGLLNFAGNNAGWRRWLPLVNAHF